MFKNIQLDPSITYTNSVYVFLFGTEEANQYCKESDSVIIRYLKEIESIGTKVYIKDFNFYKLHFDYEVIGKSDDYKRVKSLFDNCETELKEIKQRSIFEKAFIKIRNWFSGSFNNPTLAQADNQPLVLPVKETKAVISEQKIKDASNDSKIKPLIPVRTKGIRAWFRGSFNNPKD
jgi:hypothetical protein